MVTDEKKPKEFGKALINGLGFLSFLFGSLVLVSLVFGMIGSLFMSTRPLFRAKRTKKADNDKTVEPEEPKIKELKGKISESSPTA